MLRKSLIVLALFLMTSLPLCTFAESPISITDTYALVDKLPHFYGDPWFTQSISQIENTLHAKGYTDSFTNSLGKSLGVLSYESDNLKPKKTTILFDLATNSPTNISLSYSASANIYEQIYNGLNAVLGEAIYQEAYKESNSAYTIEYAEALTWSGEGFEYKLNGEGSQTVPGLYQIQTGKSPFVLSIAIDKNSVSNKTKSLLSSITTTPSPTSMPVTVNIEIASVSFGKDSIGTPQVYVTFKNTSNSESIDRIDFAIKCYDAYGTEIKPYGFYSRTDNFFDEQIIHPGKRTPSDWRWTIYGVDGMKSIDIAILKYHTTNGRTITVPEDQLNWIRYH